MTCRLRDHGQSFSHPQEQTGPEVAWMDAGWHFTHLTADGWSTNHHFR